MLLPGSMPDFVFLPLSLRANVVHNAATAAFSTLFEPQAAWMMHENPAPQSSWQIFTMPAPLVTILNGGTELFTLDCTPSALTGLPGRPQAGSTLLQGGLQLTIDTFDATAAANSFMQIDAEWLVFPESVQRSAGLYTPRLYYKTQ